MKSPRPLAIDAFRTPDRDFGILPFWFLNGELDPEEMRFQLRELRAKGMQGVVFHGRYGLEMPYLGDRYLERVEFGIQEANRLGLASWIYDEMNWPSGTADKRVLKARPDLSQRYLECVSFTVTGPWFMCLTGEDSRYLDFQRSTPVAVFAIGSEGDVVDLTSNLSFKKVVPWEVPLGEWRLCYIVEKRADYYIDAMDPESTSTFLGVGYDPYLNAMSNGDPGSKGPAVVGFYSDEPAMHYFLSAMDMPIVPWTKDMFRRFQERNGYDLRSRLLDLFFDVNPDASRTRHDFYNTTTAFYSDAYYRQIHDWCREHDVLFTAHLLFEEWLRQMVRVEGNPFRHYEHMDVVAVDHLYPVIGTRQAPDQHVALKLASSAAHHYGSDRLICESFGGIFMDATMQRMKWITDWEYVLGVNLLNPHGYHYTFEGARKRDWPPSMFYQYPWWRYYSMFSDYVSRTSEMLTGGRHVAKVAVVWPINSIFATYLPQLRTDDNATIENGLNVVTDLLLRLHHDFDYIDEEVLAVAAVEDGKLQVGEEDYELVLIPPMTHMRESTLDTLERFVVAGGRVLGVLRAPNRAFGNGELTDIRARVAGLIGASDDGTRGPFRIERHDHEVGAGAFVTGDATMLAQGPGSARDRFAAALDEAIRSLIEPDIEISNPDIFMLHRRRDDSDVYFLVNPTFQAQQARVDLPGSHHPLLWDPATGEDHAPTTRNADGRTSFELKLSPVGSVFVVTGAAAGDGSGSSRNSKELVSAATIEFSEPWTLSLEDDNALVVKWWRARPEEDPDPATYANTDSDDSEWQNVLAGAWAYQLSTEPEQKWPIPVWYRVSFEVETVPERLILLVDGFDGDNPEVWCNGRRLNEPVIRSQVDAQMGELDLVPTAREGRNVLAIRLVLRDSTGGLVDHIKLMGRFALEGDAESGYRIAALPEKIEPASWTDQGFPFYSGRGVYRTTFEPPAGATGRRLILETPMFDDVLEVEINGQVAGVRLWDPYGIDVGEFVRAGENEVALRVANTPANLLNGAPRPSGIAGAPRILVMEAAAP